MAVPGGSLMFTVAGRIFSCSMWTLGWSMWDLVPWPGTKSGSPALRVGSLSYWLTREVPSLSLLSPSFSSLSYYLIFTALSIELRYVDQPSLYQLICCLLSYCYSPPSSYPLLLNLLKKSIFLLLYLFISYFYTFISIYSLYWFSNCHAADLPCPVIAVQQSDSVIQFSTFSFIFFSIMVSHRILNIVPCSVQ